MSSLAVRQFVDAALGWTPVHVPSQPWRVVMVLVEVRYCPGCCAEHGHDVVVGEDRKLVACLVCGAEAVVYG